MSKTLEEMLDAGATLKEIADEAGRQYLEDDDDDDPDSLGNQLGAQIFEMKTGSSIEDVMNAEDYDVPPVSKEVCDRIWREVTSGKAE